MLGIYLIASLLAFTACALFLSSDEDSLIRYWIASFLLGVSATIIVTGIGLDLGWISVHHFVG